MSTFNFQNKKTNHQPGFEYNRKFFSILLAFIFFLLLSLIIFTPSLRGMFVSFRDFGMTTRVTTFIFLIVFIVLGTLLVTYSEMISKKTDELLEKIRKKKYIRREEEEELYKIGNEKPEVYVVVRKVGGKEKYYKAYQTSPSDVSLVYYTPSSMPSKLSESGIDVSKSSLIYLEHRDKLHTIYLFSHEYAHHLFWKELYASTSEEMKRLRLKLSELNNKFNELSGKSFSQKDENTKEKIRSLSRLLFYASREVGLLEALALPSSLREYHEEHSMIASLLTLLQYLKEGKLKKGEVATIIQKMIKTYTSPDIEVSYTYAIKDIFGNFNKKNPIWDLTRKLMYVPYGDKKTREIVDSLMNRLEEKKREIIERAKAEVQKGVSKAKKQLSMIERELYELNEQK
jgi:hypothetical protein